MTLEPPAVGAHAALGGGSAAAGMIRCPRCQAPVAPDQGWCLECGAAARTRLAPTPNWRAPVIALALVAVLAGVGLAIAFVALTDDNTKAPSTSTAPVVATEPTAAPPPTTPPTATATTPTTPATTPTATTPTLPTPTATTPAQTPTATTPGKK